MTVLIVLVRMLVFFAIIAGLTYALWKYRVYRRSRKDSKMIDNEDELDEHEKEFIKDYYNSDSVKEQKRK